MKFIILGSGSRIPLPGTPDFSFVPNTIDHEMADTNRPADMVINTLSQSELSDAQIHDYCQTISRIIGGTGIFFEQNHPTDHQMPGDIPPMHLNNLKKYESQLLADSFPARRGDANTNTWVHGDYEG